MSVIGCGRIGFSDHGSAPDDTGDASACIVDLAGHNRTTCAVRSDGTVWCFGLNNRGQVGDGTIVTPQPTPRQVGTLSNVIRVTRGAFNSYALSGDGTVWAWGSGARGAIGDGGTS